MSQEEALLQTIDFDEVSFLEVRGLTRQVLLQSWASHCLNAPAAQNQDPFLSLSTLLGISESSALSKSPSMPHLNSPLEPQNGPLLQHYQRSLTKLVSCNSNETPSAFDAFTQLATAQSTSAVGRALHLATLAWAGRHMTNEGEMKYEALSEKLGGEATKIVAEQALQVNRRGTTMSETAQLTLLAGQLMLIQWKVSLSSRSQAVRRLSPYR